MRMLSNIYWLGTKELRSFLRDWVLLGLVVYSFSLAVIAQARSNAQELHNASIAIVDEDNSQLSQHIARAFLPPYFKPAQYVAERDINRLMNTGKFTFIIDIPPNFERDVRAGRSPALQINVDATAMVQAGIGSSYAMQIIDDEIADYISRTRGSPTPPVNLVVRIAFNPNVMTAWFTSVMGIINSVTMLAIILAGAAVVREREHGTMDHLLVMPITPFEIAMSKIWANALVITVAVGLSLAIVVKGLLDIPIAGSVPLFMCGVAIYLFFASAVGIFLATIARTMPQLGLLYILVAVPLNLLSGANTPLESMPPLLRTIMQASPSTHFVAFAQAILYRGAGFDIVWPRFLLVGAIGAVFLGLASAALPQRCGGSRLAARGSPADENRHLGAGQHLGRLAPEQELCEPPPPVRAHHDEVAAQLLGRFENSVGGKPVAHVHDLALDPCGRCGFIDLRQNPRSFLRADLVEVLHARRKDRFPQCGFAPRPRDRDDAHARTKATGKGKTVVHRLPGDLRPVGRYEDVPVHVAPAWARPRPSLGAA